MKGLFLLLSIISLNLSAQSLLVNSYRCMGTSFMIIIKSEEDKTEAFQLAYEEIKRIEKIFSTYDEDSEVSKLNRSKNWQKVSPELLEVINYSEELRKKSGGAFDVRIGKSTKLWKEHYKNKTVPSDETIDLQKNAPQEISIDYNLVRTNIETQLDFGGIAKGYAVDRAFELLNEMGFDTILVDGGGDMRLGEAPSERGWKIGQHYENDKILWLANTSIATSGPEYQYLESDSTTYSHILNPLNQQAITKDRGVTIQAKSCMEADALATAVSVWGNYKILQDHFDFLVNVKENEAWPIKQF